MDMISLQMDMASKDAGEKIEFPTLRILFARRGTCIYNLAGGRYNDWCLVKSGLATMSKASLHIVWLHGDFIVEETNL